MGHALGMRRSEIRAARDRTIEPEQSERLEQLTRRRVRREPLQLLVGSVGFRHLDIEVRPGVFIPRPETEVLAGLAIDRVRRGDVVVEPCTGTGAIACAIATEAEPELVVATDISSPAVQLAQSNADRLDARISVLQGDLLEPVPDAHRGRVALVVSNPPYIAAGEMSAVEPEVGWDPLAALVSGETGHEVTDRLIADAPGWLIDGGWLLLEVDTARAGETAARLRAQGFTSVHIAPDLTGLDRVVGGRFRV